MRFIRYRCNGVWNPCIREDAGSVEVPRWNRQFRVDRGQKHEPLRPERDALGVKAEPRGAKPGLMDGYAVEHGRNMT